MKFTEDQVRDMAIQLAWAIKIMGFGGPMDDDLRAIADRITANTHSRFLDRAAMALLAIAESDFFPGIADDGAFRCPQCGGHYFGMLLDLNYQPYMLQCHSRRDGQPFSDPRPPSPPCH